MYGRAPDCADRHILFPTPKVPLPVCFSALTAEAAVEALPYRNPKYHRSSCRGVVT